ncbi:MAG TPA: guanylate kinase [Terriglobia bacterium]|nr:guanylate kinase [Terriglobia bacterium]
MASRETPPPGKGSILIISAPSGSGKSTVVRRLLRSVRGLEFSISYTTRAPRAREKDGKDYFFVSPARFKRMIEARDFVEWAKVYGNYYGTSRRQILEAQQSGRDILLDIDVQGHHKVRRSLPDALSVFLLPPSYQELRRRLERRHSDAPEVIKKRLAAARAEVRRWREYEYVVVNEDLQQATRALRQILAASHFRRDAQREKIQRISKTFGG